MAKSTEAKKQKPETGKPEALAAMLALSVRNAVGASFGLKAGEIAPDHLRAREVLERIESVGAAAIRTVLQTLGEPEPERAEERNQ